MTDALLASQVCYRWIAALRDVDCIILFIYLFSYLLVVKSYKKYNIDREIDRINI